MSLEAITNSEISLDQVPQRTIAKIVRIEGGHGFQQHLAQVGIHVGDKVFLKRSAFIGGPILISIHNSEIAIGRGMAKKIKCIIES